MVARGSSRLRAEVHLPSEGVEDKNKDCMRIYGQAILTDSSKESYLLNAIFYLSIITEYKLALATHSSNGYKALRELLVKTDFDTGRNQKLKASTSKYQSQSKPSIQYREKQETLVPYTRSESDFARPLWSDFERDTCLCHPHQTTDRPHSTWTRSTHTSKVTPKDS
jgi:hypothetical protein